MMGGCSLARQTDVSEHRPAGQEEDGRRCWSMAQLVPNCLMDNATNGQPLFVPVCGRGTRQGRRLLCSGGDPGDGNIAPKPAHPSVSVASATRDKRSRSPVRRLLSKSAPGSTRSCAPESTSVRGDVGEVDLQGRPPVEVGRCEPYGGMAGMPLFAYGGREKNNAAAPFCAMGTNQVLRL